MVSLMRAVVAAVVVQVMSPFISAGVMNEPPVMREREREREKRRKKERMERGYAGRREWHVHEVQKWRIE